MRQKYQLNYGRCVIPNASYFGHRRMFERMKLDKLFTIFKVLNLKRGIRK